ncbi:hypothetical protein [Acidianus sp. HS-5]|uniref:hypothetical protein n=1 Tax=Acidianus sp. HS-5 TaxID=2886040 RepID=UPI001F312A4C|nr:hypothetical protein [Acidianus sp. HS-5]
MKKGVFAILLIAIALIGLAIYSYHLDHSTVITKVVTQTRTETLPPFAYPDLYGLSCTYTVFFNGTAFYNGTATITSHQTETTTIPPPYYANLWVEMLVASVVLLLIAFLLIRRK